MHAIEDECIREVVRAQENVGLKGITDGEFRRTFFHVDFLERFEGVETHYGEFVAKFRKDDGTEVGFKPPTMHVGSKVKWVAPIQGPDFDFLKKATTRTPKVCIPAPSMLHFRGGREAISEAVYPRHREILRRSDRRLSRRDHRSRGARPAAICNSTTPISPISAIPTFAPAPRRAATTRTRSTHLYCRLINDSIRDRPPT